MSMPYNAWQEAIDREGLTEGPPVKFANERWSVDGATIAIGEDGVRLAMLMPTATHGRVLWRDRIIVDRRIFHFEDCPPSTEPLDPDWQLHTACQVVGMDEEHSGRLMAFSSGSLGGRLAFMGLIPGYGRKDQKEFPIVCLGSRMRKGERRDYVDPTFTIIDWRPRSDFVDYLPPPRPPRETLARLLAPPMETAPPLDDEAELARAGVDPEDVIPF
jgi:hypothetical protein